MSIFSDQNYYYSSVAAHIVNDARYAPISYTDLSSLLSSSYNFRTNLYFKPCDHGTPITFSSRSGVAHCGSELYNRLLISWPPVWRQIWKCILPVYNWKQNLEIFRCSLFGGLSAFTQPTRDLNSCSFLINCKLLHFVRFFKMIVYFLQLI